MKKKMISYVKDLSLVDKNIDLEDVLDKISGSDFKTHIETARESLEHGDKEGYGKIKKSLPAVTFAGTFQETRKNNNLATYSGLVILDIDHIKEDLEGLKSKIASDEHTRACFISPSGHGLKILVVVDSKSEMHFEAFRQVAAYYGSQYSVQVDQSGKDLARLCFVSYDPELYRTTGSKIFNVVLVSSKGSENESSVELFNNALRQTETRIKYTEGSRNDFVFLLANNCNRLGVPYKLALDLILKAFGYNKDEVKSSVKSAYKTISDHAKSGGKKDSTATLIEVESFLLEKYSFRMNVVSGNLEISEGAEGPFKQINDYMENSILRELKLNGFSISSSNLASLLRSDFADLYDPFKTYISNLPDWDGIDHLKQLTDTVLATNDDYWAWIFKKWIVGMIAGLIHEPVVNHTVLVFVGGQGVGKTTWIENLVPKELKNHLYSGTINTSNKDTLVHLSECMLINMDEMENLNRSEIGELKQLITKSTIRLRKAYGRNNEVLVRRASFAGSVNNSHFLNDQSGSRRFLVAEVEMIDLEELKAIDLAQVYAQVKDLLKEGYRFWFDKEENDIVTKENRKYQLQSIEEELIGAWFSPATKKNATDMLSASQIGVVLSERSKYPLNQSSPVRIGKTLKKMNFQQVKHRGVFCYPVILKEFSEVEQDKKANQGMSFTSELGLLSN